jgi:hypothetical protein
MTAAFAVGISHFVGDSPRQETEPRTSSGGDIKFAAGPAYAPGTMQRQASQPAGSSLDMFMKTNSGYSTESQAAAAPKKAARPRSRAELDEFMRQVRSEVRYDKAAQAAAPAGAETAQGNAVPGVYPRGAAYGRQAGAEAVGVQRRTAPLPKLQTGGRTSMSRVPSTFAAGSPGAATLHGISQSRAGSISAGASADQGGSQTYGPSGASDSESGNGLNAGEYGSHGGGQASSAGASSAGGQQQAAAAENLPPAPIAYIWPRSLDFGDMYMYETASRQVVVMNIGNADLKLGQIDNIDDESPFFLENDGCSSKTLKPKAACTFRVRFAPRTVTQYRTAFEVPSNDDAAMAYQSYVEFDGNAKYSPWTSWWFSRFGGTGSLGTVNRLDLGMVPEGYAMNGVLRISNNSGRQWYNVKLDASRLPASFRLTADNCAGADLAPGRSCSVTVTFTPDSGTNRKFSSSYYGQYLAVNTDTKAGVYSPRPHFPPLLLDGPVQAAPKGQLLVTGDYDEFLKRNVQLAAVNVQAESCAAFPVYGLVRAGHYYYFK